MPILVRTVLLMQPWLLRPRKGSRPPSLLMPQGFFQTPWAHLGILLSTCVGYLLSCRIPDAGAISLVGDFASSTRQVSDTFGP